MSEKIHRHGLAVRACHWLIAASALLLAFSGIGFMPLYGRFFLNDLPGMGWVSDFDLQMRLHYLSALVFLAAGAFHLAFHGRRGEFTLLPRRGDLRESAKILVALLAGQTEPPHGKFLAEQRLAYAAIALAGLLLAASGLYLSLWQASPIPHPPAVTQAMVLLHLGGTFVFLGLVVLHLAAFLLKANRPLLPAMFGGRVPLDYARKRHPLWKAGAARTASDDHPHETPDANRRAGN